MTAIEIFFLLTCVASEYGVLVLPVTVMEGRMTGLAVAMSPKLMLSILAVL